MRAYTSTHSRRIRNRADGQRWGPRHVPNCWMKRESSCVDTHTQTDTCTQLLWRMLVVCWSRTSHVCVCVCVCVCVPVCVREQQQLLWRAMWMCRAEVLPQLAGCGDLVQTVQHTGRCFRHWVVVHRQTGRCKTMFVCTSLYVFSIWLSCIKLSNQQYTANQTPSWELLSCQNSTCHSTNKYSNENVW